MKNFELLLMLEKDETVSFIGDNKRRSIRIDKYNLETKKMWSIKQEFSIDGLNRMIDSEDVITKNIEYMIEDIRNANKR